MPITIDLNKIISKELNEGFGEFDNDGLPDKLNTDEGLLNGLRASNMSHVEHKNLSFNFDMVLLQDNRGATAFERDFGYPEINHQQIFRVYDDVKVVGYIVDIWGTNRSGFYSNFGNGNGIFNSVPTGKQSRGVSFRVKLLGNYTTLDQELGYPSIYKSTEFNLLNDLIISWDDRAGRMPTADTLARAKYLSDNNIDNGWYVDANKDLKQEAWRQIFYPIDDSADAAHLLGGAEYILEVSQLNDDGSIAVGASFTPSVHPVTSLQVTLVCECNKRRYS